jgi:hypothetical protein
MITSYFNVSELHHASGGCWGGATVDDEFWLLLVKIFGSDVMKEANVKYPIEILDMFATVPPEIKILNIYVEK